MTTRAQFFTRKERKRYYKTAEIYHPTLGVQRYVANRIDPKNFTLESTAPRNASESVAFTGATLEYFPPEQNEDTVSAEIQLGRVGRTVKQQLKSITGFSRLQVGEIILREYIEGEESAPVYSLLLYISTITMTQDGVVILAEQDNPAGRGSAQIYTGERFPGLRALL